ncbi:MAG TPA: flagellar hook-associated protein FlgK [Armatimonadota bacterium]|nr:flagellar hook-associated protein FlgK [Armatimonadota bacterium]
MSTFDIIRTAFTGLLAQQKALDVTGHNVANLATPGYHRQEAVLRATPPPMPSGGSTATVGTLVGTGVDVVTVQRMQDAYLEQQVRNIQGQNGRWETATKTLQQIETFLAPSSELNLATMLDRFFSAWQQLSVYPEEQGSRSLVQGEAANLTTTFNNLAKQLTDLSATMDASISARVTRLNQLADELAALNGNISGVLGAGGQANDLLDRRDAVLGEIATLAGITSLSANDDGLIINLDGRPLVQGSAASHLSYGMGASGWTMTWDDGAPVQIRNGEIAGLFQMRDTVIPDYLGQLDTIASALVSTINALHQTGTTMQGTPAGIFFDGNSAGSIAVHAAIAADARAVAATRVAGAAGDGRLAAELALVAAQPLIGNQTLGQAAASMLGQIGHAVRGATTAREASATLLTQLDNQIMATSGVNLDEEMMNLLVFQRAYDASARVLTVADEMVRTVIDRLGVR